VVIKKNSRKHFLSRPQVYSEWRELLVLLHNIHNFLHHISQEVMVMARKSTGKNTDTNQKSFRTQLTQLITAKNVKLREVCCENAEKKVNGYVCNSDNLKCNPAASTAAPCV